MTAVIHKICVGARGKYILLLEESPCRNVSFGEVRSQKIAPECACHYGGEDNKEHMYSNASFSSVTAATESLGLSDNGFKTA